MSSSFAYYIFALVVIIVGFILIKKVAGCIIKSVLMIITLGILLYIYLTYFR